LPYISSGSSFVVGDARGLDTLAQTYLREYPRVIVYHLFKKPRNNIYLKQTIGGFKSDDERDSQMTKDSTDDILWIRDESRLSGTKKNKLRRLL